jgi:probable HAF family extracellular repeat protein
MFATPGIVPWQRLMLASPVLRRSLVCLPLAVLLFACQSPDHTVGPGADDEQAATESTGGTADRVLALATPPGLGWYRRHTHPGASRAPATFSQQPHSRLAVSVSEPTDLGTRFSSNTASVAVAINATGQLAGWTGPVEGPQVVNAIRWEADGTPVELPKATEEGQAMASDVNDAGVVVGSDNELHEEFGWRSHARRWNPDGTSSELPVVPGSRGESAVAINASGVIVGWTELVTLDVRAVRWDAQGVHILPSEGTHAAAVDVNDAGTSVGHVYGTDGFIRPATWSPTGTLTILSLPAGDNFGFASGINNVGQVVGTSGVSNGPDLTHHAVIWTPEGTPTVIPNSEKGEGSKINDAGIVVGYVEDVSPELPGQTGAIWIDGERIFAPPSPTARTVINDLSENQLAGGFYPNSELHAARWSFSASGAHFDFKGFFAPVRNPGSTAPYVVNRVRAGQAVPVKFSLNGDKGLNILAGGYPRSKSVPCTLTNTEGGQATRAAGRTGLSYRRGADQYSYIWKTDKAWAGTCRQLMVGLTDGTIHTALFRFVQ